MSNLNRSKIRRLVIQEHYRTSLIQQLYEQSEPAPADPAAPADDPSASAAPTPADAAPTPAPPTSGSPSSTPSPIPEPVPDPAAAAPIPAIDPTSAAAPPPMPAPLSSVGAPSPSTSSTAPAAPTLPTPAGAAPTPKPKPKPAAKPGTAAAEVDKAGQAAIKASEDNLAKESFRRRSLRFLIEQSEEEPSIDIGTYAGKLANLINNYTSLVDVKKNVIDQAEKFLDDQFPKNSEALKKQLKDLLRKDYHISLERPEPPSDSYAVGAKSGGGGAA